jgi:hypothetical protein
MSSVTDSGDFAKTLTAADSTPAAARDAAETLRNDLLSI